MTDALNTRKHPRFAVQIEAEVLTRDESITALTKDMSRGGICLICPKKITLGSAIDLSLSLTLGADVFSESLEIEARVVWCTPINRTFQVGAMFAEIDREKMGYLEMFLRFLEQEVLVTTQENKKCRSSLFDTGDNEDQ